MSDTDIARLIREILAEELTKISIAPDTSKAWAGKECRVAIETDAELQVFVRDILRMADNPKTRESFEKGQIEYRLKNQSRHSSSADAIRQGEEVSGGGAIAMERGLFSERQVDLLSSEIKRLRIGKTVIITPLARDRLRQRGIIIERMDT